MSQDGYHSSGHHITEGNKTKTTHKNINKTNGRFISYFLRERKISQEASHQTSYMSYSTGLDQILIAQLFARIGIELPY